MGNYTPVDDGWSYCPECGSDELRHQEGDHKQCARCGQEYFADVDYTDVVRLHLSRRAALAQNTKGEAVAWQRRIKHDSGKWLNWEYFSAAVDYASPEDFPKQVGRWDCEYRPLGVLHAERARVPDGLQALVATWREAVLSASCLNKQDLRPFRFINDVEALLAAAPSQRAEVK